MQGLYHRDTFRLTELSREEATATLKEVVPYISASIWRVELNSHHVFRLNSLTCTCTPHKTRRGDVISLRAVAGHVRGLLQQEGEAVGHRARIEVPHLRGPIRRPVSLSWGDWTGTRATHVHAQTLTRAPARSVAQLTAQNVTARWPALCRSKT